MIAAGSGPAKRAARVGAARGLAVLACFSQSFRSKFTRVGQNSSAGKIEMWPGERRVARWAASVKRAGARFADRAFPRLACASLAMEAAALESPEIPQLFSRDLREIPPTLNEDLLDLCGRSEQVLANHFTFLNHTEVLQAAFDWELHESPAWRRELHAFDYALDLALACRISQEDRFARHLRYLIAHWIAENPPGQTTGWQLGPLARRVRNWILAADLARNHWEGDPEFLSLFRRSLALQCVSLGRHAPAAACFETGVDSARALLLAGRFFRGTPGEEFRLKGLSLLQAAAGSETLDDSGVGGRSPAAQLRLAEALVEGVVLHTPGDEARTHALKESAKKVLTELEGVLLPDGTLPLFGPSARSAADDLENLFALGAVIAEEPAWKALAGKFGILPYLLLGEEGKTRFDRLSGTSREAGSHAVPELGLYRLGGTDRSAMVIVGSRSSSENSHEDYGSYQLSLDGHRVVVDSGAYSPEGETWDRYFTSGRAHNVLLIDGEPAAPAIRKAAQPEWISVEGGRGLRLTEGKLQPQGVVNQRALYRLGADGWAVLDRVAGKGCHRLVNLIHFYPTFEVETLQDRAILRSRSTSVSVIPVGLYPAKMAAFRGLNPDYPGWYAPDIGVKFAAAVLTLEVPDCPLPCVGGYLIVPGTEVGYRSGETVAAEGIISFELSGKKYLLPVS